MKIPILVVLVVCMLGACNAFALHYEQRGNQYYQCTDSGDHRCYKTDSGSTTL